MFSVFSVFQLLSDVVNAGGLCRGIGGARGRARDRKKKIELWGLGKGLERGRLALLAALVSPWPGEVKGLG